MVSLTDKYAYYAYLKDKPKLFSFFQFINKQNIKAAVTTELNEIDNVYFELLQAISGNNKMEFEKVYINFSKRKPSTDSVWIHNDFFIFLIMIGITSYGIDKTWALEALSVRPNANDLYQSVNKTLHNILVGAFEHDDNICSVVIVFLDICNRPQLPSDKLNGIFKTISSNPAIVESNNDFIIMATLRAYELIIESKESVDSKAVLSLKIFRAKFKKRAILFGQMVYTIAIALVIFTVIRLMRKYTGVKDYVSDIGAVFQLLGLSMFIFAKYILKYIQKLILSFFGYKEEAEEVKNNGNGEIL